MEDSTCITASSLSVDENGNGGPMFFFAHVFSLGWYFIIKFLLREYKLVCTKYRSENTLGKTMNVEIEQKHTRKFRWDHYIYYRLDYHLSTNPHAKPNLLLGLTFLLIEIGSVLLFFASPPNQTMSSTIWIAWTYVAGV